MKLFSQDGIEMMDVKSIDQDGDRIVIKGKMMGTMATKIYVKPEDMWAAFTLFPWSLKLRLPLLLLKGYRAKRAKAIAPK
ncbi:hypothetical protein [Novosphingobium sp. BL-52-GroH]|uniref:hypothetical protein n=1 Tax=Novosphingobium sp. BL-52-GroH TaxID=3349877 RepID=UPI00384DD799